MASIRHILDALQAIAPSEYALSGDKIGLQIGDLEANVKWAQVSLDRSFGAVTACRASHSQLLLSHHPLIWQPLTTLTSASDVTVCVRDMVAGGINLIAAHTNWDCAPGGVNDALAAKLGLMDVTPFGSAAKYEALKLVTFCPADSVDGIFDAAAEAGAGVVGGYRRCGFHHSGEGTFEAPKGSSPVVGKSGKRNRTQEVRLEMELSTAHRSAVEAAVRAAHPYEAPAIDFLVTQKLGVPIGRKGRLKQPLSVVKFHDYLDRALETRSLAWDGRQGKLEWVAVVGGAADDEWRAAYDAGCEGFITGEVKQHNAVEGSGWGINMFAAGHYATEQPGMEALAAAMRKVVPDVEWNLFVPNPGKSGRPL